MNTARAAGASARASWTASGVTPCAIPSSVSYSGATNVAEPPLRIRPSIRLAWELRCSSTCVPGGARARHNAWLPWEAPLVRNHVWRAP